MKQSGRVPFIHSFIHFIHSFIHSFFQPCKPRVQPRKPCAHPSFACTNEINSPRVHSREIPRVQTRLRPSSSHWTLRPSSCCGPPTQVLDISGRNVASVSSAARSSRCVTHGKAERNGIAMNCYELLVATRRSLARPITQKPCKNTFNFMHT